MGFKLGNFLKKALNPFAPVQTMIKGINQAKSGDWKGALKTSMIGGLTPGSVTPDVQPREQAQAAGDTAQAMEALGSAAGEAGAAPSAQAGAPMQGFGGMRPFGGMRLRSSFGGGRFGGGGFGGGGFGGGGFMGGGMDEGLRKIIRDYYAKQRGGGGGMAGGGGSFA